jgi:hypothetical protein
MKRTTKNGANVKEEGKHGKFSENFFRKVRNAKSSQKMETAFREYFITPAAPALSWRGSEASHPPQEQKITDSNPVRFFMHDF